MQNCYTIIELTDWVKEIVDQYPEVWFTIEPKVDGVSASLIFQNRKFHRALTRGDGEAGEDVTKILEASGAIPLRLPEGLPDRLEVRGEVWISKAQMERLNRELERQGKKVYTSQRNLASGTLKLKDPSEAQGRNLRFHPWDCFGLTDEHLKTRSKDARWRSHSLQFLELQGFGPCKHRSVEGAELLKNLQHHIDEMRQERGVVWHGLGMLTDGLVIKVDTPSVRESLGQDSKYPNWARAYKFQDSKGETTLLGLEWYCSRNGKLTPVGILEPIVLNGATISKVNLNNITYIQKELGINTLPCKVEVIRSGDVIPIISRVLE